LNPRTARLMANPGKTASPGACSMNARPVLLSIKPHDGMGGWVPSPRKLSDASMRIALPSQIDAMIRIGCRHIRKDVADDNTRPLTPERVRGFDVAALLGRQHRASHDTRVARDDDHGDGARTCAWIYRRGGPAGGPPHSGSLFVDPQAGEGGGAVAIAAPDGQRADVA
jgi:hypothetical protein